MSKRFRQEKRIRFVLFGAVMQPYIFAIAGNFRIKIRKCQAEMSMGYSPNAQNECACMYMSGNHFPSSKNAPSSRRKNAAKIVDNTAETILQIPEKHSGIHLNCPNLTKRNGFVAKFGRRRLRPVQ